MVRFFYGSDVAVKSKGNISQNFLAFSENMNFTYITCIYNKYSCNFSGMIPNYAEIMDMMYLPKKLGFF